MIQISSTARTRMIEDALEAFPDECCGFLFGTEFQNTRIIAEAKPVFNAKEGDKRRRFEISPRDYLKAEQYADTHNVQLLGVYHSHPDHPAIPSETDLLSAVPNFSYIILSVIKREFAKLRSWQLDENGPGKPQFREETVSEDSTTST